MKYAICIMDGASGEPLAAHGGRTTLEAAYTPHLDALASAGQVGLARNVPEGLEPSSNVACTSICGYDPARYPIGRGALEGAALGIKLADDEVALRLNLTHVSPEGVMVSYSTDNISGEDGHALLDELAAALDDDTFTLHAGTGFRGILVVKGHPGLMDTTFAAAHNMTDELVDDYPSSGPAAGLVAAYCARAREVLAASPTNARREAAGKMRSTDVFAFWPGQRPAGMEPFRQLYGVSAGMMSGVDLLNGIAQLSSIRTWHFEGVTDGPDNDYAAQGEGALRMLEDEACDVAIIHVEAPDAEGHDGNAVGKKAAVEAIDREILSRLRAWGEGRRLRILALPDHPTPVATKRHTREPVPFVLAGPGISPNGAARLTEGEAAATGLVVEEGFRLMSHLLQ
ncbi:MAG: 2,3-bisphosphoglycerate-independent phosphoglycerate mutase [Coriobacteriales bacterium]|nr:2,3-bisphosphoglycerate-independent phosphoglycerate mutase [Coriobacteriales bacterium]